MHRYLFLVLIALTAHTLAFGDEPAKPKVDPPVKVPPLDPDTVAKIKVLMEMVLDPKAADDKIEETMAAIQALEELGEPAVPYILDIAFDSKNKLAPQMQNSLIKMGKPALAGIKAKWPELKDDQRWQMARVLEAHDKTFFSDYAIKCLDLEGPLRIEAWRFLIRAKDSRAKDRYLLALAGKDPGTPANVRWALLPNDDKAIYDEQKETEILIDLLKPESWLAKGEGITIPKNNNQPWWPDGRQFAIRAIQRRKIITAAPALLKVLQEKGKGEGYLVERIAQVLGDFKYKEAIPELELIAVSKPASGKLEEKHPQAQRNYKQVQELATSTIKRINDPK